MADDPAGMFDDPATWAQAIGELACKLGRRDLERRLSGPLARTRRNAAVVVVAGEHRQGKSALVNALVGRLVCPFDAFDATTVPTLVCGAPTPQVTSIRVIDGDTRVEALDPAHLADAVTERGNPGNTLGYERVEIGLSAPLLDHGAVLVDLPGGGALRAGLDESALWWCGLADLVILTSAATAELSASEIQFARAASQRGATVVVALTRIDHVPRWRAVLDADEELLAAAGLDAAVMAVSPHLATVGLLEADSGVESESRIAPLRELVERVVRGRRERAERDLVVSGTAVLTELAGAVSAERARLADPSIATDALRRVEAAEARVAAVRASGARWATTLTDQLVDLIADTTADVKRSIRAAARRAEEALTESDHDEAWQAANDALAAELGLIAAAVDAHLREGAVAVIEQVGQVIGADLDGARLPGFAVDLDVDVIWADVATPLTAGADSRGADLLTAASAITGGMSLIGGVLHLLPTVVGSLLVASPLVTVAGLAIGGQRVRDARRRKRHQERLQLVTRQRKTCDVVQQELLVRLGAFQRALNRAVRDEAQGRLVELANHAASEVARLRAEAGAGEQARLSALAAADRADSAIASLAAFVSEVDP